MTTIHRDDLTGEEYTRADDMLTFGVDQDGVTLESFDVHLSKFHDDPEGVAERLHESVDEWLRKTREEFEHDRE